MISYENYKVIHLASLFILFTGLSISFYGIEKKHIKVLTGIGTLISLVAGMGLMARLGIGHGTEWPLWIKIKMTIWFLVAIGGAVVAKRFRRFGIPSYFVCLLLFILAAVVANYKI
jgi:hypothetical protein